MHSVCHFGRQHCGEVGGCAPRIVMAFGNEASTTAEKKINTTIG
jgi:hypothetical protein